MAEGSLDERATTIGEGQYEHTSQPTPSPICSSPSSFSCIFLFFALYFLFLQVSQRSAFQIEVEMDLSFDLAFLNKTTLAPQSSVRPPSDSYMAATCSTVSHFLGFDLLSLSTS